MAIKNTIKVKKYSNVVEELVAGNGNIKPGMLLSVNSAGAVIPHAVAQASGVGSALPMFALEDELQGNGVNDLYANASPVQVWVPGRGDMVYALLATANNVAIGDLLVSNGTGALKKYTPASTDAGAIVIGQAVEALNNATGSDARLIIRII